MKITSLGLILLSASTLLAGPKMAKELDSADRNAPVDVIIQFKKMPTHAHHKKVTDKGGSHKGNLDAIKGGIYSVSGGALATLVADADVDYISPDREVRGTLDYASEAIGANLARSYGYTGKGVGVAIIDSGFSAVSDDLNTWTASAPGTYGTPTSRIVYAKSFAKGGTADDYGHGTHVAGVVGGNGYDSIGQSMGGVPYTRTFFGVAPDVKFVNLRVLDKNGAGKDSNVIAAISEAIRVKSTYNIRVINLSLGRPVFESHLKDPLCQAVEAAWKAGIVVVVSAGNSGRVNSQQTGGYATITSPGNDPYVITVGAMKTNGTLGRGDDTIASYSSKGPSLIDHIVKPDLVAPGNKVISLNNVDAALWNTYSSDVAILADSYIPGNPGYSRNYARLSGTSMAAPMVSGAAALLLQQNPSLTPDQIKARLMRTALKSFPSSSVVIDGGVSYYSQYDVFTVGAGYLNIPAALADTALVPAGKRALSPLAVYDAQSNKVQMVFNPASVCGDPAVRGSSAV